jgi:hypothetical protein
MYELQHDFLLGVLAPFLTEAHCPVWTLPNPGSGHDDIPEDLIVEPSPWS